MRLNIYAEEIEGQRVEVVSKMADTGTTFYGLRFFLKSPEALHHTEDDDDRSAVTFWFTTSQKRADYFGDAFDETMGVEVEDDE